MARTARSVHARKKRRKVLEQAKGYRGTKKSSYKRAKEQVWKGGVYAYAHRKQRKRDFRSLWIQRINAGAREHGLSYSQLVHGLRLAEIELDRKILADLAATEPDAFAAVVSQARNALDGEPVQRRIEGERRQAATAEPEGQKQDTEVEATEAAERKAEELDVDLSEVEGTGSEGNVLVEDVEDAAGEVKATDAARRKAEEFEVDLSAVEGTGVDGRITVGDVEKAAKKGG
jgi:large subunit ribosomal protein L20